jgi:hypothetical protein
LKTIEWELEGKPRRFGDDFRCRSPDPSITRSWLFDLLLFTKLVSRSGRNRELM